jgi:hypothetical protein
MVPVMMLMQEDLPMKFAPAPRESRRFFSLIEYPDLCLHLGDSSAQASSFWHDTRERPGQMPFGYYSSVRTTREANCKHLMHA